MVCIYCGGKTKTTNSRGKKSSATWRRRQCLTCSAVFTTREAPDLGLSLRLEDSYGALLPFSRDKLVISLHRSLSHRKTALGDVSGLADTIIASLLANARGGVIKHDSLIEQTLLVLERFDKAAYTHYRAHHPSSRSS